MNLTTDQLIETLSPRDAALDRFAAEARRWARAQAARLPSLTLSERERYEAFESFLAINGHDLCNSLLCGDDVEIRKLTERLAAQMPPEHDSACACCGDEHG